MIEKEHNNLNINLYYYFFYTTAVFFAKTINKKGKAYLDSAFFFVSLCVALNILTLLGLLELQFKLQLTSKICAIVAGLVVMRLNYIFLWKGGKGQKIFDELDKKSSNKNHFWKKIIALLYVLLTFAACIYVATLVRATYKR